ncbi:MAG: MATE family efflux transporter [Pseudomonadota bacterium]
MYTPTDRLSESTAMRARRHVVDLVKLAWPVMISRAGILIMAFADIAMLGRYGDGAVGISNLALAVFIPVLVLIIGLTSGMIPVVSQAFGAGNWQECGRAWRRAMAWGLALSLVGTIIVWKAELLLGWFGQSPEMARAGGNVAIALAPGLIAQIIFAVCAFYLESTGRPMFAMVAMLVANIVNVALNWVMIFGNLGFPELGAVGAAVASTVARVAAAGLMLWLVLGQRDGRAAGVTGPWETAWGPGGWRAGAMMRKLGVSAGLSNGFETIGFSAMSLIAGTISIAALDAYSISHNLVTTLFMVGLGLSVATGVRVGQAIGAGEPREAVMAGWTGLGVAMVIMTLLGVSVLIWREAIAFIYTDDPYIAARVAGVLIFSAFVFVPDSLQVVMGQAIRALGDAWVPLAAYAFSFLIVMIPLGLAMINAFHWDERGLVLIIALSCLLATALLVLRFSVLCTRLQR